MKQTAIAAWVCVRESFTECEPRSVQSVTASITTQGLYQLAAWLIVIINSVFAEADRQ